MHGWVVADLSGSSYLVRSGTGVVRAVVPVGHADMNGCHLYYRVEVDVDPPVHTPRSIRFTAHATVGFDDPVLSQARVFAADGDRVIWAIEWHRHEWVPGHVLITGLDLATEARAHLVALDPLHSMTKSP